MTKPVVILHTNNPDPAKRVLEKQHDDLEIHTCDTYEALPALIENTVAEVVYSVRFNGTTGFPKSALIDSTTVKWVSVGGSGTDHLNPWDADLITVTNAAGVAADMMAQYAIGSMYHFSLNIPVFRAAQQKHEWISGEVELIDGKTVLVIGLGKTGQAVARLAKVQGLKTLGVRANPTSTPFVDEVHHFSSLDDLLPRADFIVVCVPLLESTRGILNTTSFSLMKYTTVVIDVSRGGVIEESAMIEALEGNRIRGAALDVFETEPLPAKNRLWDFENVIVTPHCSSVYHGWDIKSVEMFSENLSRYRAGKPLHNIVNPQQGY